MLSASTHQWILISLHYLCGFLACYVVIRLGWGFKGMWNPASFLNCLAPLFAGLVGAQEWPSVTRVRRVGPKNLATRCSCESSTS